MKKQCNSAIILLLAFMFITASASSDVPNIFKEYTDGNLQREYQLYDWSDAGYRGGVNVPDSNGLTSFNVREFGAIPSDDVDDTSAIQAAIDAAAQNGGGVILLEAGQYDINKNPEEPWASININSSNIIFRGESADVTTLKQWKVAEEYNFTNTAHTINVGGADAASASNRAFLTKNAPANSHSISIASTAAFKSGDTVVLRMYNPDNPRLDTLSRELITPLTPEDDWIHLSRWAPFRMVAQIDSVVSSTELLLKQRIPRELKTQFDADIRIFNLPIKEIGIENITIEGMFFDDYGHHKSQECDYGWNGIKLVNVQNSWVRNVKILNCVQDITLSTCYQVSVSNIENSGNDGHFGIQLNSSWFCLVEQSKQFAFRTHNVSVSGDSLGNVFSQIHNLTSPERRGSIDFHGGGMPSFNLFEQITKMRASGAGSVTNMPHSGQYNVFWNVTAGIPSNNDFFTASLYDYSQYKGPFNPTHESHRLFPKSMLIGVYDTQRIVTVNNISSPLENEWVYMAEINNGAVSPESLYKAQREMKLAPTYKIGEVSYQASEGTVSDVPTPNGKILYTNVWCSSYPKQSDSLIAAVYITEKGIKQLHDVKIIPLQNKLRPQQFVEVEINLPLPMHTEFGINYMIWNMDKLQPL